MAFGSFFFFFFLEGGAAEKVKKNPIDIAALLVKAKQHKRISSSHPALPLLVLLGRAGPRGGGEGRPGGEQTHICSPGGVGGVRGVDCATDRRSDPAALFEQQVKGRAVPQCIVCLVVFGGVLVDADGEGLND